MLQVAPTRGLMLIFPSWLIHQVYPFIGEGERRSIAFNGNYAIHKKTGESKDRLPVVEWIGGSTKNVQGQYTYWDKTKIKGETK